VGSLTADSLIAYPLVTSLGVSVTGSKWLPPGLPLQYAFKETF
jgi:hypothetical protein